MRIYRKKVGQFINKVLDTLAGRPDLPYIFEGVKVGDRFKHVDPYHHEQQGVLTVTELTEAGFKYTLEKPYHCFPARWGPSLVHGGELLINDPAHPPSLWNALYEKT